MSLFARRKNGIYKLNSREFRSRIKRIIGSRPSDLRLYEIAFIHRSASLTLPDGKKINNERLEFLGDSVLDVVLSEFLFKRFPVANEGFMTKIRSRIVNRDILNQIALSMGIDKILVSNISSGHSTKHLYGDAFEALVGAVFIDKGFRKTRKFIIRNVIHKYLDIEKIINTDSDYKSLVFEWVQKNKASLSFIFNEDYDFDKKKSVFTTTLNIDHTEFGKGQGESKKEAEQEASRQAWERLKDISAQ
ncbi:MAG TPA: ribonuclease III [Bacteroidales bacterium]|nr:ribonuclease III [Bacteroidales bacterium]